MKTISGGATERIAGSAWMAAPIALVVGVLLAVPETEAHEVSAAPTPVKSSRAPQQPAGDHAFVPLVTITDPITLAQFETNGLDAGSLAFDRPGARSLADLSGSPGWTSIANTLRADLAEIYARDSRYGVGMRFSHRGFDPAWLISPATRFELAAVVNRIDRRVMHPGTCGELRFVYRLAYSARRDTGANDTFSSRLPFTLNVVFFLPDDGARCARRARELTVPDDLLAIARARPTLKSVEINFQSARWPSTVRPDLGGHADYVLRAFRPIAGGASSSTGTRYVAGPLENTPDVDRIERDPALARALLAWLRGPGVLAAIDRGTALLPDALAATRAISVTPRGLARARNAPFRRLLDKIDLGALPLATTTHVRTPAALLRRLDALTCVGCHQSRSLAGFHVIGAERDPARVVDAIAVALSPHMQEDLPRRRAYVAALAAGQIPDEMRPPAEHETNAGTTGHACGLGDPGFAAWTCAPGHACLAVDDPLVGQCLPTAIRAGNACRPGVVDFATDRISRARTIDCGEGRVCEDIRVGFPGGMCASDCDALMSGEICGAIALLTPFNNCLARGGLFAACAKHARPAGLQACDAQHPCRPDYLCARVADHAGQTGACIPPYFVLQMRVDGHQIAR